jgi:thioredoxin reductase
VVHLNKLDSLERIPLAPIPFSTPPQGPNTSFLSSAPAGTLDSKGRIIVNDSYQSKAFPSVFAAASVSDKPTLHHPVSVR